MKSLRWGKLLRGKMERVRRLRLALRETGHPIPREAVLPSLRGIVHPHLRGVGRMRWKHLRPSRRRKFLTWTTGWAMPRTTPWALVCGWMKMQWIAGTRPSDAAGRGGVYALCNQLPQREYERISREIYAEDVASCEVEESARTYAAYHVVENGQEWYYKTTPGEELLGTARIRTTDRMPTSTMPPRAY